MLNDNEFKEWCKKLELAEPAIEIIHRVRASEPSRRVGGGSKNVVGAYPSQRMGKSIQFESNKVELPGLYIKEHNDDVKEMYDQPPAIKLTYKSLNEKVVTIYHTPDYFVLWEDKAGWEEWKSEEELCKLAEKSPNRFVFQDGQWRCPPGEEYAQQFGLHYWLKSSKEINWLLQRNIVFLEDYMLDKNTEPSPEITETVLSAVRSMPAILLLNLLDIPDVEADDIYLMIAKGKIYVDLEEELLSEPQFTHVFIDKQTALAYKTMNSRKNIPMFKDHTLQVSPGTKVLWDGKPWTIVNLGERKISLSAEEGIVDVNKEQFYNMVCENHVKGVDNEIIKAVNSALNSKIAGASEEELKIANYRYDAILPMIHEGLKLNEIKNIEVTDRTIRNWVKDYKEAEQHYGSGYIGLIPRTTKRGNRIPHLPEDTLISLNEFLDKNETITNQSNKVLYGKFQIYCEANGIIPPSSKTFGKIIKSRSKYQRVLKTQGPRAAYQEAPFYCELDMTTPRHGERPFEIAHLDHTEIDLELIHSKTKKNLKKAWLTLMVDAYTRRILAFYLTFDSPSYRSDMMVLRECVRRFNRLPQIIITDNGADFKSTYFQSLLALYGVTHKKRPAHKSRVGSVGERLFGTAMSQLIHNLQGNTKIMKNCRQVTKSVNPKNHAVWTLPLIYELLKDYLYDFYDTHEHSSLGESPREAFERGILLSGKRPFRFIPYNQDFIIMTLPMIKSSTATVDPQRGVKVNYTYYYCRALNTSALTGAKVPVRYDPWNKGIVYCYVRGEWTMCYSEYYAVFKNRTEVEINIASQELLKQKQDNAKKASITAKRLAEFISQAEVTQELLNQRLCDSEMASQFHIIDGGVEENGVHEEDEIFCNDVDINEEIDFSLENETDLTLDEI